MATDTEQLSTILKSKDEQLAEKRQEIQKLLKQDNTERVAELQNQSATQTDMIASLQSKCSQLESFLESKQTTLVALEDKLHEQREKNRK